jgi:hypothetical protein
LAAYLALLALGVGFYLGGGMSNNVTMKGIGTFFSFMALVGTAALLLRWLIYRRIG